jgi:hypothetical protein
MSDGPINDIALAFSEGKKEGMEEAGERIFNAILNWSAKCPNCDTPVDLTKLAKSSLHEEDTESDTPDYF